jgi:cytidylate kinase
VTTARPGLVVALDGPGSSGKSSVGAAAALQLGYRFCDTGLLYRAATWLALERRVRVEGDGADPQALVALVQEIELVPDENGRLAHVSVAGADVTDDVHTPRVDEAVSAVSRVAEVTGTKVMWSGRTSSLAATYRATSTSNPANLPSGSRSPRNLSKSSSNGRL